MVNASNQLPHRNHVRFNPNVAHSPLKRPVAKKPQRPIADMQSVGPLIGLGRSIKRG
jgi:hypothetical protein